MDCVVIYVRSIDDSWTLLVKDVLEKGFEGKFWSGEKEHTNVCIPFSLLENEKLDITHFYGPYDLKYKSLTSYFFEGVLPIDKLKIAFGKLDQFIFNRKGLIRSERIDTLKIILEKTIESQNFKFNEISLATMLHTQKWVFHPDKERQLSYSKLLLESLVESGELIKVDFQYKLSPKALSTISDYEDELKKHNQNLAQSKSMKWLTIVLIIVAVVQTTVTYITST
ncbi:hypothetical protein [Alteromonas sp. 14N.309.X.WAT.G.H12]|uniref:hypothetical protein n=1 Tax=Alteromonas sp. 14N.309.X.WAT.G.H12 TaxID=3120824 RepID=UPI002FD42016